MVDNAQWTDVVATYNTTLARIDVSKLTKDADRLKVASDKFCIASKGFAVECAPLMVDEILDNVRVTCASARLLKLFDGDEKDKVKLRKATLQEMAKLSKPDNPEDTTALQRRLRPFIRAKVDAAIKMK